MSMRIKSFLFMVATTLAISSCNNDGAELKHKEGMHKARMKSTTDTEYRAVEKFGEVQRGDIILVIKSNYKKNGSITEWNSYNPDGDLVNKQIYRYNENGKRTETNLYFANGDLQNKFTFMNDSAGFTIQVNKYDSKGELEHKVLISNDSIGNPVAEEFFLPNGIFDFKVLIKYNDHGEEVEWLKYDSGGGLMSSIISSYEQFDNKGNWKIKKSNGDDFSITERKIKYY